MNKKIKFGIAFLILIIMSGSVYSIVDHLLVAGSGCLIGGAIGLFGGGSCSAYNPDSVKGDKCSELCGNKDIGAKCTEYLCNAIGRNCVYEPSLADNTEGVCRSKTFNFETPVITSCGVVEMGSMSIKSDVVQISNVGEGFNFGASNEEREGICSGILRCNSASSREECVSLGCQPTDLNTGAPGGAGNVFQCGGEGDCSLFDNDQNSCNKFGCEYQDLNGGLDIPSGINGCNLGDFADDGVYGLILSTNVVSECRYSPLPERDLFGIDLYSGVTSTMTDQQAVNKINENARRHRVGVMYELPNGKDHVQSFSFADWSAADKAECADAEGCILYAQCENFNGQISEEFFYRFKLVDGPGDIAPPAIHYFDPVNEGSFDNYTLPFSQLGQSRVEFLASDLSGIDSCRYSEDYTTNFDDMQEINCREPNLEELQYTSSGAFIKICDVNLENNIEGENDYFFMCKDRIGNVQTAPYKYLIIGGSKLQINIVSPNAGETVDQNDILEIRTSGGVGGEAECTYSYGRRIRNQKFGETGGDVHKQRFDFFTANGEYILIVNCDATGDPKNKASTSINIKFEKFVAPPEGAVACSGNDNSICGSCPGDAYCAELESQKFLCDKNLNIKQSCIGGYCSTAKCPSVTKIYTASYCALDPTPLCLSDQDNDDIADALDCNDQDNSNGRTIGQCVEALCKTCSENPEDANNDGICVTKRDCVINCDNAYFDQNQAVCLSAKDAGCKWSGNENKCGYGCVAGFSDDPNNVGVCVFGGGGGTPSGCEITEVKWYNPALETGQPYSNGVDIEEGTKVALKVKGNAQCNNADVVIDLYDYENVVGENVYEQINFMDFPRTLKLDQLSDSGGYYKVAFITLLFQEDANMEYRDSDPELVAANGDIISASSQKKSQIIKIKPKITPPEARAGEDCKTSDDCNGKWGVNPTGETKLICVKTQENCPYVPPPIDPKNCDGKKLDAGESCDGSLLNGNICSDLGYSSGTLRCKDDCTGFDINSCRNPVQPRPGEGCTISNCPGIYDVSNRCVDVGGDNCPAVPLKQLKIENIDSTGGNIVALTNKDAQCEVYNSRSYTSSAKVSDMHKEFVGENTHHSYSYNKVGTYDTWWVKCSKGSEVVDKQVPRFTVTPQDTTSGDNVELRINRVFVTENKVVVAWTSGGRGNDGSADCEIYSSGSFEIKVGDMASVDLGDVDAHSYKHPVPGTYNGWRVRCEDNGDVKTQNVPGFTISGTSVKPGDDCETADRCDGKYNSDLTCVKTDASCPVRGEITVTINSPRPNEQFGTKDNILLQVTSSETADCKYATFEMGVDSEPDYNTMINMIPTSASRKLIHTKQINYNGEKGYYFRCKNVGKEGFNVVKVLSKERDVTGTITVNILSPNSNAEFVNDGAISLRVRSSENAECRYTSYNIEDASGGLPNFESMSLMNPLTSARTEHLANEIHAGKNIYYFKCKNANKEGDNYVMVRTKVSIDQCPYDCNRNNICIAQCGTDSRCTADLDCSPICNANGICDAGETINNCANDCAPCVSGTRRDCGVSNIGLCSLGKQTCVNSAWGICSGNVDPVTEICGDNSDNDCDSSIDEGCACTPNGATRGCGTDAGVCTRGTQSCANGDWSICNGVNPQANEICNNDLDDDCDSSIDEGCDLTQCNTYQSENSCKTNNCKWSGDDYKCDDDCASGWDDTNNDGICTLVDSNKQCRINQIRWVKLDGTSLSSVEERAKAYAIMTGTNCEKDRSIGYKIYEEDKFLGLDLDAFDDELPGGTVSFIDDNVASLEWIATRIEDDMDPNNEYYIRIIDTKSNLLKVLAASIAADGSADNDGDGLTNDEENEIGTDPNKRDTDDDGFTDGEEVEAGTDPLDRNSKPSGISGSSSLIVAAKGPSTKQDDTRALLFIDLRRGPSNFGKDAECRYTNTYSNDLINNYDSILFPEVLNFDSDVVGGATRYSKELEDLSVGEHTYYIKCRDKDGKVTGLETVRFNVEIPASEQISVVRKKPEGTYGKSSVALEVETQGGIDNGVGVRCTFSGIRTAFQGVSTKITEGRFNHRAVIDGVADGDYNINVACVDRAGITVRDSWSLNVREDKIIPSVTQIISRGSSKYVSVNEVATCEASESGSQWAGVSKDTNTGRKHLIAISGSYYFRCRDLWDNQMNVVKINP